MGFENEFSFSFKQWRTIQECPRRWWLEKIGSWKGWFRSAPAAARHAYRCKQMSGSFMLAGHLVHEIAKEAVVDELERRAAEDAFHERMRQSWREAKVEAQKLFSDDPKHLTNLFELFYRGHDIGNVKRFGAAAFRRGIACVEAIYRSAPYEEARAGQIIEAEKLRRTMIGLKKAAAVPVWLMIDLAYRDSDGVTWLWDWKTGKPGDSDIVQVLIYALAAMDLMDAEDPSNLRLGIMYLKNESEVIFTPEPEQLSDIATRAEEEGHKLRSMLDRPDRNEAPKSRFPRTEDLETCRRCQMFFACKGHRDLGRPDHLATGFEE